MATAAAAAVAVTSYVVVPRAAAVFVVPTALLPSVFASSVIKAYPTSSCTAITSRDYGWRRRRQRFGSLARAGISLLTASRVAEGSEFVRIMGGSGSGANVNGVGKLLVLDEFFKSPNTSSGILVRRDPDILLETLIYYFDDEPSSSSSSAAAAASSSDSEDSNEEDAQCEPRHGVQLYMESSMQSLKQQQPRLQSGKEEEEEGMEIGTSSYSLLQEEREKRNHHHLWVASPQQRAPNPKSLVFPIISHAREVSAMTSVSLDGGAAVRVVAGNFSRVSIPPPLHDFLMLDVSMRPGSAETFPLMASFGLVVYILEGVGIFKSTRFAEDTTSFYQNEGHGLYIPTRSNEEGASTNDLLHVQTHDLSHLRFLLLGVLVSS